MLLDTNILIYREDDKEVQTQIQKLFQLLSNTEVLIHPVSKADINKDRNKDRKNRILSKINTYKELEDPPSCDDNKFHSDMTNDEIDDQLLCAVKKNAVHFLITNDMEMHSKAKTNNINNNVLQIDEAIDYLSSLFKRVEVKGPIAIEHIPVHNLDVDNPFFNPLREDYQGFDDWFRKISQKGRKCYFWGKIEEGEYYAICIYKEEKEPIILKNSKPRGEKDRLKIATLLASRTGYKIGELFLKLMFEYALRYNKEEIYLTHFVKKDYDYLVNLIEEYGFQEIGEKGDQEEKVYLKNLDDKPVLTTKNEVLNNISRIYPYYCDRKYIRKFIIPIQPQFHDRLFTNYSGTQTSLREYFDKDVKVEGNTIKKVYISNSNTRRIRIGDMIFFYRSNDEKRLSAFGVVNEVHYNLEDPLFVIKKFLKRTVYTEEEIFDMIKKKNSVVILFTFHRYLKKKFTLDKLKELKILKRAPQSITNIDEKNYLKLKEKGDFDEHYIIN